MTDQEITILERATRTPVSATLFRADTSKVIEAEKQWLPHRAGSTGGPEHSHWDWEQKASRLRYLAYQCWGIECRAQVQGLVLLRTAGTTSRLGPNPGHELVYVSYLEVAPWNLKLFTDTPCFGAVGSRLMEVAVRISQEDGFHGRVGLHSLPQAESFYADSCGMTRGGPDPACENLMYFEFDPEKAKCVLERRTTMKMNDDHNWLKQMADTEDYGPVSVGGLAVELQQSERDQDHVNELRRVILTHLIRRHVGSDRVDQIAVKTGVSIEYLTGMGLTEANQQSRLSREERDRAERFADLLLQPTS